MDGINWDYWEPRIPVDDNSDTDSSSDDWEESMDTSELDFPSTDSETDDEDFVGSYFPKLSRFLINY